MVYCFLFAQEIQWKNNTEGNHLIKKWESFNMNLHFMTTFEGVKHFLKNKEVNIIKYIDVKTE